MKNILAFAALALCIISCTIDGHGTSEYGKGLLEKGTAAPDITLLTAERPDGIRLSELRGGYVLIEFWASWCPDCRKDIPAMKELYAKYGRNIKFVSVSFDEKKDAWTGCVSANGMEWLQLSELKKWKETSVSKLYNVKWIPAMYLIDRQGRVVMSTVMVEKLAAKLKELHEL